MMISLFILFVFIVAVCSVEVVDALSSASSSASASASASAPSSSQQILVIGSTGGTGLRALRGLLDSGYKPSQIRVLTRSPEKPLVQSLSKKGFVICKGDLDWNDNDNDNDNDNKKENENETKKKQIQAALQGCCGYYVHSTSSDTKQLDRVEVSRAINLRNALLDISSSTNSNNFWVVYNSAAGENKHGVKRIQQKHDVESVFLKASNNIIKFTSLRANLFMEELWKRYTRPSVLEKGMYTIGTQATRKIYLTSVRDMGHLAGKILKNNNNNDNDNGNNTSTYKNYDGRIINVAGDVLTAPQIAQKFSKAQGSECIHKDSKLLRFLSFFFFRELYQIIRFYRRSTETTDIQKLKEEFNYDDDVEVLEAAEEKTTILTDFETFLEETEWGNRKLAYDDFSNADRVLGLQI
jgi:hypothetical protein